MFPNLVTSDKMVAFTCMWIAYTKHIHVHVDATINITTDQPTYIEHNNGSIETVDHI